MALVQREVLELLAVRNQGTLGVISTAGAGLALGMGQSCAAGGRRGHCWCLGSSWVYLTEQCLQILSFIPVFIPRWFPEAQTLCLASQQSIWACGQAGLDPLQGPAFGSLEESLSQAFLRDMVVSPEQERGPWGFLGVCVH